MPNEAKVSKFYGQELNRTTYNLARMNMILYGVHFSKFDINQEDFHLIFNSFPDGYISSFGKDFALSLLRHNRERLLNSASAEQ